MDRTLDKIRNHAQRWERNFLPVGETIAPRPLADFIQIEIGLYICEALGELAGILFDMGENIGAIRNALEDGEPIDSHPADVSYRIEPPEDW